MEDDDYITIMLMNQQWTPVRMRSTPHGFEQAVDMLDMERDDDITVAKRAAVYWARVLGLNYKVPVQ